MLQSHVEMQNEPHEGEVESIFRYYIGLAGSIKLRKTIFQPLYFVLNIDYNVSSYFYLTNKKQL